MDQWFEKLTDLTAVSVDEKSLMEGINLIARDAGFNFFAYLSLHPARHQAFSTYPEEWQRRYFDRIYGQIDPIVGRAKREAVAFTWNTRNAAKNNKTLRTFYGEAAEFGITAGLTVPIRTGFGHTALLTLASDQADLLEGRYVNPIEAATAVAHLHIKLASLAVRPTCQIVPQLRPEELLCLRWSAEGKSMRAIAQIENMSFSTVRFFIENAKISLGASTLPQATAIAKELGLI